MRRARRRSIPGGSWCSNSSNTSVSRKRRRDWRHSSTAPAILWFFREYVPGPEDLPERELRPTDRIALWNVFNQVLRRLAEKVVVGEIEEDTVTVAERMEFLLAKLRETPVFLLPRFSTDTRPSVQQICLHFSLAILELTRLKRIKVEQSAAFADIRCSACFEEDLPTSAAPFEIRVNPNFRQKVIRTDALFPCRSGFCAGTLKSKLTHGRGILHSFGGVGNGPRALHD